MAEHYNAGDVTCLGGIAFNSINTVPRKGPAPLIDDEGLRFRVSDVFDVFLDESSVPGDLIHLLVFLAAPGDLDLSLFESIDEDFLLVEHMVDVVLSDPGASVVWAENSYLHGFSLGRRFCTGGRGLNFL